MKVKLGCAVINGFILGNIVLRVSIVEGKQRDPGNEAVFWDQLMVQITENTS